MKSFFMSAFGIPVVILCSCKSSGSKDKPVNITPYKSVGLHEIGSSGVREGLHEDGIMIYNNGDEKIKRVSITEGAFKIGGFMGVIGMDLKDFEDSFGVGVSDNSAEALLGKTVRLYKGFFVVADSGRIQEVGVVGASSSP